MAIFGSSETLFIEAECMIVGGATAAIAIFTWAWCWRRVRGLALDDGSGLALQVLRRRSIDARAELGAHSGVAVALALRVLHAPTRELAEAEIREAVLDVAAQKHLRAIPKAAGRTALTVGTLGAVVEVAQGLPDLKGPMLWASLGFGSGLLAWMACGYVGRRVNELVRARLETWSELCRVLERICMSGRWPGASPAASAQP